MKQGRLIVIDGGEGAGKGTVLNTLKKVLSPADFLFTREPGGSPFGEEIRNLILSDGGKDADAATLFALFWAARADHSRAKILPAISAGRNVISDRYDSSTWAYQICAQGNSSLKVLFWPMREIFSRVMPYLYIYMDVDPAEGLRRAKDRGELSHFDVRDIDFHSKVRAGYLQFLALAKARGIKTQVVDANKAIDEVVSQVVRVVCAATV